MSVLEEKIVNVKEIKWLYDKIKTALNGKVDKEDGKGLSTNDYTTADKNKLEDTSKDLDVTTKRLDNLIKLSQGKVFDYQTDETEAYSKAVPLGSQQYGSLDMVGGKSLVYNQLQQNPNFESNTGWRVFNSANAHSEVSNNVCTVTIDTDGKFGFELGMYQTSAHSIDYILSHKYLICFDAKTTNANATYIGIEDSNYNGRPPAVPYTKTGEWQRVCLQTTCTLDRKAGFNIIRFATATIGGKVDWITGDTWSLRNAYCIDLTKMFGEGNEPTLEQCREIFPAGYYPYNEGELMNFGVNAVESKKGTRKETFTIPQSILDLPMYGASAGSVYNYIDFERKVYVQNVGSVDLGTLTWTKSASVLGQFYALFIESEASHKAYYELTNDKYANGKSANVNNLPNKTASIIFVSASSKKAGIYLIDTDFTGDATAFKNSVSGSIMNYELVTPIETDISDLIDNGLIFAEGGGTITFKNVKGDEYHIPVPNKETYMVKLADSI